MSVRSILGASYGDFDTMIEFWRMIDIIEQEYEK